ncbi:UNVERIFIED_CONTAM: hypothetical protein PYX00_011101 [Menopon gallinae]|uniref:Chaperone protein HscA homolog n=1 Tax=Menopon gallinae TaxID=328185 RepID=A0AAW2H678_9NEOP
MKLLKITDPLSINNISENNSKELVLGIDLGTTNSVIATYVNNKIQVINIHGKELIPSMVAVLNNEILVGEETQRVINDPNATIFKSVKRFMGRSKEDVIKTLTNIPPNLDKNSEGAIKLLVNKPNGKSYSAVEISSFILKYLKNEAEKYLNTTITKVVITVPAYFNEQARLATKQAAELAGLKVLRLINEPTAAALAYGLDDGIEGTYLIYDLGGGTFDVSILRLNKGVFQVIATKGDLSLGGDDFDYLISLKIIEKLEKEYGDNIGINQLVSYIIPYAKEIKEELSNSSSITKEIKINNRNYKKTITICKEAIEDANITLADLKGIILVGGSSKISIISNLLVNEFKLKPYCSLNPEQVVAIGAAYQAASLNGDIKKSLLLDITPLSLGIETYGGITEKIIFRNTPIPIAKGQEFTTFKDNQTSLKIHIVQGERELVKDNQSLAQFTLKNIPPMPAGVARILVTFTIDADGLLTVTASEKNTNITQYIEVKPAYGLQVEDIKNMILDGITNAEEDLINRSLQLAQTEAMHLVNITQYALSQDKDLISTEEVNTINSMIQKLINTLNTNDINLIKAAKEDLTQSTQNFATKRINKAIKLGLEGKKISAFKESSENT